MGSWKYWWQTFLFARKNFFSFCPVSFQILFYSFLSSKSAKEPLVGWPHPKSSRCWSEPLGRIRWRVFWRWLAQRWWMKWAMISCLTTAKECNQFSPSYSFCDSRHAANVFANDGSWLRFRSPVITIICGSRWNTAHEASTAAVFCQVIGILALKLFAFLKLKNLQGLSQADSRNYMNSNDSCPTVEGQKYRT